MNKTERLLATVLELQRRGTARAEDLARHFETSVRTIYRDITALSESGVPIVATPGQGYTLMDGYFLPPLSFTPDEATLLVLGAEVMAESFDDEYARIARAALAKIETALPSRIRGEVSALKSGVHFIPTLAGANEELQATLRQVRRAILSKRRIRFGYATRFESRSPIANREIDPLRVVNFNGAWYVNGYDHDRKARRNFRLSRMSDTLILAQPATHRDDAQSGVADEQGVESRAARSHQITLQFDKQIAPWVRESPSFFTTSMVEDDLGLRVTLMARSDDEVLSWVLQWGASVAVIAPATLQERVRVEAQRVLERY